MSICSSSFEASSSRFSPIRHAAKVDAVPPVSPAFGPNALFEDSYALRVLLAFHIASRAAHGKRAVRQCRDRKERHRSLFLYCEIVDGKNLDVTALLAKANAGDDAAMKQLSDSYYAKRDSTNGLKWETKAAEKGDSELQKDLGWRYENGSGVTKDIGEARQWYVRAGEQGNETAQLDLGESYGAELRLDDGVVQGSEKDDLSSPIPPLKGSSGVIDEAFRWCVRAGNRGMVHAEWYAGVLTARGSDKHRANFAERLFLAGQR